MTDRRRESGGRRISRQEAATRDRGARARAHLARARERERRRLAQRERERDRARRLGGAPDPRVRRRRRALHAGALALGVVLASWLDEPAWRWLGPEHGAVQRIAVQGHDRLSGETIAAASGVERGAPLAGVVPARVEARLREAPWIRHARVLRLPPSTLVVRVEERVPRAVLVAAAGEAGDGAARARLVDADGTPFAAADVPDDLPRLVGGADLTSGRPHAVLVRGLELLDGLAAAGAPALADAHGRWALRLPEGRAPEGWVMQGATEVVLGREPLGDRIGRLARLLDAHVLEGEPAREGMRIDLRFAGQAVLQPAAPDGKG